MTSKRNMDETNNLMTVSRSAGRSPSTPHRSRFAPAAVETVIGRSAGNRWIAATGIHPSPCYEDGPGESKVVGGFVLVAVAFRRGSRR